MISVEVHELLRRADGDRRAARWQQARDGYLRVQHHLPRDANVAHNLALCHLALAEHEAAVAQARRAITLKPDQALSCVVLSKALTALGRREDGLPVLEAMHRRRPDQEDIRIELARVCLHHTGDMARVRSLAAPVRDHPVHGDDAVLVAALSTLYDRPDADTAASVSDRLRHITATCLHLPVVPAPVAARAPDRSARLRVGLLSPQFFASPVYFFAIGALRRMGRDVDLVFFARGTKEDWATQAFRAIATEWLPVVELDAEPLARVLAASRLDALIDLGGWMDPVGLKALSARPAPLIYKWVGGQSATTGLEGLAGFVTDELQSPPGSEALHAEPLVRFRGGYASYTPPPYLPAPRPAGDRGHDADGTSQLGVIANPAKLSREFLAEVRGRWPDWNRRREAVGLGPLRLVCIDRRYRHAETRRRVVAALGGLDIAFVTPDTHRAYLEAVRSLHAVIDTFPYSGGLTTTEALSLRVPVLCRTDGALFCERHTVAHALHAGLRAVDVSLHDFQGICPPAPDIDLVADMERRHVLVAHQWLSLLRADQAAGQPLARRPGTVAPGAPGSCERPT